MARTVRLVIVFLVLIAYKAVGQDLLFTKDNGKIKCKIIRIGNDEIVYKTYDNPEFDSESIAKSSVSKIVLANGDVIKKLKPIPASNIGLQFSPAFPIGAFSGGDLDNNRHGLALQGMRMGIEGRFFISRHLALSLNFSRISFGYRGGKMTDFLESNFSYDSVLNAPSYNIWRLRGLNIGLRYQTKIGKSTHLDFGYSVGPTVINHPNINYSYFKGGKLYEFQSTTIRDEFPLHKLDARVVFMIAPQLSFDLHGGILMTNADLKISEKLLVTEDPLGLNPAASETVVDISVNQSIRSVYLGFGFSYLFKRKSYELN